MIEICTRSPEGVSNKSEISEFPWARWTRPTVPWFTEPTGLGTIRVPFPSPTGFRKWYQRIVCPKTHGCWKKTVFEFAWQGFGCARVWRGPEPRPVRGSVLALPEGGWKTLRLSIGENPKAVHWENPKVVRGIPRGGMPILPTLRNAEAQSGTHKLDIKIRYKNTFRWV